jgi:ATP-binding cassette subfamily B protein
VPSNITQRKEWQFFSVLPRASSGLAAAWWAGLLLLGLLPAAFAVAMGVLVGAVRAKAPLEGPLLFAGRGVIVRAPARPPKAERLRWPRKSGRV